MGAQNQHKAGFPHRRIDYDIVYFVIYLTDRHEPMSIHWDGLSFLITYLKAPQQKWNKAMK